MDGRSGVTARRGPTEHPDAGPSCPARVRRRLAGHRANPGARLYGLSGPPHPADVAPRCPQCGAIPVPGATFCAACGTPLSAPTVGPAFAVSEFMLGEIPAAFSVELGWGPVRVVFTDQRVLVLWTGPHSFLPNKRTYLAWKQSLPPVPRFRTAEGTWSDTPEPPAWELTNRAIVDVRVRVEHGFSPDPDVCDLSVTATGDGFRTTALAGLGVKKGGLGRFLARVPGPAPPVEQFLRGMPIASALQ